LARLQALRSSTAYERESARKRELKEEAYRRSILQLQGALRTAERDLKGVKGENKIRLAQNKTWKTMAELGKVWHERYLDICTRQLENCKIYAPQSGMVAYHVRASRWGGGSTVKVGDAVNARQRLMTIPNLERMQVKTAVHETVVDRVKAGMRATVRVDAFPNRSYEGTVESVDVLPDPGGWLNSDTKVFTTIVTIDEEVEDLKPGMTAVAEIQIDSLSDVLGVPVEAIVQRDREDWCYVVENGRVEERRLETGRTNYRYVEVVAGLDEGEQVVLNPSVILDADLGHREIAPDIENQDVLSL
jgi:RND family efflux transporter MFP subunit